MELEMTIFEFKKKYGVAGIGKVIGEFICKSPSFEDEERLAKEIGKMIGDLEWALAHLEDNRE